MASSGFRRSRRGAAHSINASFSETEAQVLRNLLVQMLDLLGADDDATGPGPQPPADPLEVMTGMTGPGDAPVSRPDDPVLARLLPDAYADDPERAAEFRRFTEQDLRAGKRAAVRRALESLPADGGRITVDDAGADAWLGALNDLRLALGTRLDVTEDTYAELDVRLRRDPDDPRVAALSVYAWLGYLQESLVEAVS
jgi:hypothetical protein